MTDYRTTTMTPPLAERTIDLAALSPSRHHDVVAELGTGYGVGAAWTTSAAVILATRLE